MADLRVCVRRRVGADGFKKIKTTRLRFSRVGWKAKDRMDGRASSCGLCSCHLDSLILYSQGCERFKYPQMCVTSFVLFLSHRCVLWNGNNAQLIGRTCSHSALLLELLTLLAQFAEFWQYWWYHEAHSFRSRYDATEGLDVKCTALHFYKL